MSSPSTEGSGSDSDQPGQLPPSHSPVESRDFPSASGSESLTSLGRSRTQSSLRTTPRSSARVLGTSSQTEDEPEDSYELNLFAMNQPRSPPPADPREQQYQDVRVGDVQYTKTIEEDLNILDELGFIIDYKNGLLGSGFFGSVYKGYYGSNAQYVKDKDGRRLRNVENRAPFAVKIADFESNVKNRRTTFDFEGLAMRESYEMEKFIMTFANHKNIVPIRMAINMGEPRTFHYRDDPSKEYVQHERVYLIMDFAELGSLMDFMDKNSAKLKPYERVKLARDCFMGMKYLHNNGIVHGDVHMGNVLIFKEDQGICAKWIDFGLGYVNRRGEHVFQSLSDWDLSKRFRSDVGSLYEIIWNCWGKRRRDEEDPDETWILNRFLQMNRFLVKCKDLDQAYEQFADILDETKPRTKESLI